MDSIEANVETASIRVSEGADELRMAERYQVRSPLEFLIFRKSLQSKTHYLFRFMLHTKHI